MNTNYNLNIYTGFRTWEFQIYNGIGVALHQFINVDIKSYINGWQGHLLNAENAFHITYAEFNLRITESCHFVIYHRFYECVLTLIIIHRININPLCTVNATLYYDNHIVKRQHWSIEITCSIVTPSTALIAKLKLKSQIRCNNDIDRISRTNDQMYLQITI